MTMIKQLAVAGAIASAIAATPAVAAPYTAPSASGTATVRFYNAITLTKVANVDFGTIIRDSAWGGGYVSLDNAGSVAADCGPKLGVTCTGATTAGEFTIKGDSGSSMSVQFSSPNYDKATNILTLRNGSNSSDFHMQFAGMTQDVDPNTAANLDTYSLTGTGADQTIKIFGDIYFGNSTATPNGVYSSSFTLTADYQ